MIVKTLGPATEPETRTGPGHPTETAPARPRDVDLVEVVTWSCDRLEAALREGQKPDPRDIAPYEWNGYNVPWITKLLGIRKFKKGFVERAGKVEGYNVRVAPRGGPLDPWEVKRDRAGRPIHHGFYDVVEPRPPDDLYPNALLIDYDCGRNPRLDPSGLLRDYIVRLGPDTMLGKAYVALGAARRVAVSYFVLQRADRVEGGAP